jgi:predicted aspartyl protease
MILKNKLLLTGAVLLLTMTLSGCNLINIAKLKYANDDLQPRWGSQQHIIALDTAYHGEKPYVFVDINGVKGFKMLIDTGASFTILQNTKKVKALKLPKGYELELNGWGDTKSSPSFKTDINLMNISGISLDNLSVAYLAITKSPYYLREDEAIYDGVIGHDILKHFSWHFDKKQNQVLVSNQAYRATTKDKSVSFDTFFSKISIPAKVTFNEHQTEDIDLIVDTGSRHYLKISSAYIEDYDIELPKAQVSSADFGLSGIALHQRVSVPQVTIIGINLTNVKTNIIVSNDEDFSVIGNAVFGQFVTVIDYFQDKIFLSPNTDAFKSRYNLLGVELRKLRSGNFIVRYISPDLVLANTALKVGDEIIKINDVQAVDITHEQWLELTNTPGVYRLCLAGNSCLSVESKEVKGFSLH